MAVTIGVALFAVQVQASGGTSKLSTQTKRLSKSSKVKSQQVPAQVQSPAPNPPSSPLPSTSSETTTATSTAAVPTSLGRRVSEVVAQAQSSRNSTATALDPKLLELAGDSTAYVDGRGEIFFVEAAPGPETLIDSEALPVATEPVALEGSTIPTGSVFELNSRPGSTKTIYIDFDGETVANTFWNRDPYFSVTMPPFSRDADPAFGATDLAVVRDVWLAVAEDFAPFDVNVTTQRPGPDAFFKSSPSDPTYGVMAVVTTGNKSWLCGSCGGVAYLDVFSDGPYFGPAWALPSASTSTRYIASTVSHEVGHNLALQHDGGTANPDYYSGHGVWGPIMGASSRQYTQWSKGEYSGANNAYTGPNTGQDDIAIVGAQTGFVPDENNSFASATLLPSTGAFTTDQVIGFVGDTDFYAFDVTQGYARIDLERSAVDPNLSAIATLYNPSGVALASTQIVNSGSLRLDQSLLPPGRYYVGVAGGSYLSPLDGFSSYDSLGYFRIAARVIPPPYPPIGITVTPTGDRTMVASWANIPYSAYTYSVQLCSTTSGRCTAPVETTTTSASFSGLAAPDRLYGRVAVRNQLGETATSQGATSSEVLAKPLSPTLRRLRFNSELNQLTVEWDGGASYAPVATTSIDLYMRNPTIGTWTAVGTVFGESGSIVLAVPPTWDQVDIEVKMVSRTSYGPPWNEGNESNVGTFRIGRVPVPQSPVSPSTPRGPAPQAPGVVTTPRGPAPQA